jgi:hypothetical protein
MSSLPRQSGCQLLLSTAFTHPNLADPHFVLRLEWDDELPHSNLVYQKSMLFTSLELIGTVSNHEFAMNTTGHRETGEPLEQTHTTCWLERPHASRYARCIAVKSSVPQGMIVCFDKEVGWCVGIAVILVCREGPMRRSRWMENLRQCWEKES